MMKCGHCRKESHVTWDEIYIGKECLDLDHNWIDEANRTWVIRRFDCPQCHRLTLFLRELRGALDPEHDAGRRDASRILNDRMIQPEDTGREPMTIGVPSSLARDYREACQVLKFSPKASAALSRRCLQQFLREHAGVKLGDLASEIEQVLNNKTYPPYLAESIDAVRHIGNFATHPMKSKNTGEILDVEPEEAEWLLNTLEGLFEHTFVKPEELKRKREATNAKLKDAGKPLLK